MVRVISVAGVPNEVREDLDGWLMAPGDNFNGADLERLERELTQRSAQAVCLPSAKPAKRKKKAAKSSQVLHKGEQLL